MTASLTKISITTRKIIRYSIYGFIAIILTRALILGAIKIYKIYNPDPPPPAEVKYGRLPSLPFPQQDGPMGLTYMLETPTGGFPEFSHLANVFLMPRVGSQLLSLDYAQTIANKLKYLPEGDKVTETIYKFYHKDIPSELQVNIATGIFSLSYNLEADPSPLEHKPPLPEVAASKARGFISGAGLLPDDLKGPTKHEFVKLKDGKIVGVISHADAQFTKVYLFRTDYDELPSLTSNPDKGNVWFIVSGEGRGKTIIAAEYHYFPVDETSFSSYPIITPQVAWEDLNNGKGFVARLGNNPSKNITVRRIYLAYFDPGEITSFYQPIFVFEGDNDFLAYVPAVTPEYYGN